MSEENKKKLIAGIQEIDKLITLGEEGLARSDEVSVLRTGLRVLLEEILDLDSIEGRKYDKWRRQSRWHTQSRDGFAVDSELSELKSYKTFLIELLDDDPQNEKFKVIKKGKVYDGRKAIRKQLESAITSIDIHDNYIGNNIIEILEPYIESGSIKVRITTLTSKLKLHEKSDLLLFIKQYQNVAIKNTEEAHARFIIIDGKKVVKIGASLKDFGRTLDTISEVLDDKARKQLIENFEEWWSSSENMT